MIVWAFIILVPFLLISADQCTQNNLQDFPSLRQKHRPRCTSFPDSLFPYPFPVPGRPPFPRPPTENATTPLPPVEPGGNLVHPSTIHCNDTRNCCSIMDLRRFRQCATDLGCIPWCRRPGGHWWHQLGYISRPNCVAGRQCCQLRGHSRLEYYLCCIYHGCCPASCTPLKSCRKMTGACRAKKGTCRKTCGPEEVTDTRLCRGRRTGRCNCCIPPPPIPVGPCEKETREECCQYDQDLKRFLECSRKHKCSPICTNPKCMFNNETYNVSEVVRSYPKKCYELKCELTETAEAPHLATSIVEYQHHNGCDCCVLAGNQFANGHLLTDDDYCVAIQCVDGEWINQGYMNSNCRSCLVHSPAMLFKNFDSTTFSYGDDNCRYSLARMGKGSSYIHVEFQEKFPAYAQEAMFFKDTDSTEVTCSAHDVYNDCSFGPLTTKPMEVTPTGTLAMAWTLAGINTTFIMGTNKITAMYSSNTLFVLAPLSLQGQLDGMCGNFNGNDTDDGTANITKLATQNVVPVAGNNCSLSSRIDQNPMHPGENSSQACAAAESSSMMANLTNRCEDIVNKAALAAAEEGGELETCSVGHLLDTCIHLLCLCRDHMDVCESSVMDAVIAQSSVLVRLREPEKISLLIRLGRAVSKVSSLGLL